MLSPIPSIIDVISNKVLLQNRIMMLILRDNEIGHPLIKELLSKPAYNKF